jgi:hypothetical protein
MFLQEEVINPEDVDPSVGRFRNLVQTSMVIPSKVYYYFYLYKNVIFNVIFFIYNKISE